MPIPVKCACGTSYTLKDEYAGQVLRCPSCGAAIQVGRPAPVASAVAAQADPVFDRDKFLLRQQHFAISEKYQVHDEQGRPIVFVQRPARLARSLLALLAGLVALLMWIVFVSFLHGMVAGDAEPSGLFSMFTFFSAMAVMVVVAMALSPLRHVTFYRDDTKSQTLLDVLQDSRWQIPIATYTLRDATGTLLARFRKNYLYNIFRKRWECHAPGGRELCVAKEDSILLSLLRRVLGPLFGFLRTNFIILRGEQVIGEFNRKFTILDRYVLDMSADARRTLDRRIALALGVMLDTGERR